MDPHDHAIHAQDDRHAEAADEQQQQQQLQHADSHHDAPAEVDDHSPFEALLVASSKRGSVASGAGSGSDSFSPGVLLERAAAYAPSAPLLPLSPGGSGATSGATSAGTSRAPSRPASARRVRPATAGPARPSAQRPPHAAAAQPNQRHHQHTASVGGVPAVPSATAVAAAATAASPSPRRKVPRPASARPLRPVAAIAAAAAAATAARSAPRSGAHTPHSEPEGDVDSGPDGTAAAGPIDDAAASACASASASASVSASASPSPSPSPRSAHPSARSSPRPASASLARRDSCPPVVLSSARSFHVSALPSAEGSAAAQPLQLQQQQQQQQQQHSDSSAAASSIPAGSELFEAIARALPIPPGVQAQQRAEEYANQLSAFESLLNASPPPHQQQQGVAPSPRSRPTSASPSAAAASAAAAAAAASPTAASSASHTRTALRYGFGSGTSRDIAHVRSNSHSQAQAQAQAQQQQQQSPLPPSQPPVPTNSFAAHMALVRAAQQLEQQQQQQHAGPSGAHTPLSAGSFSARPSRPSSAHPSSSLARSRPSTARSGGGATSRPTSAAAEYAQLHGPGTDSSSIGAASTEEAMLASLARAFASAGGFRVSRPATGAARRAWTVATKTVRPASASLLGPTNAAAGASSSSADAAGGGSSSPRRAHHSLYNEGLAHLRSLYGGFDDEDGDEQEREEARRNPAPRSTIFSEIGDHAAAADAAADAAAAAVEATHGPLSARRPSTATPYTPRHYASVHRPPVRSRPATAASTRPRAASSTAASGSSPRARARFRAAAANPSTPGAPPREVAASPELVDPAAGLWRGSPAAQVDSLYARARPQSQGSFERAQAALAASIAPRDRDREFRASHAASVGARREALEERRQKVRDILTGEEREVTPGTSAAATAAANEREYLSSSDHSDTEYRSDDDVDNNDDDGADEGVVSIVPGGCAPLSSSALISACGGHFSPRYDAPPQVVLGEEDTFLDRRTFKSGRLRRAQLQRREQRRREKLGGTLGDNPGNHPAWQTYQNYAHGDPVAAGHSGSAAAAATAAAFDVQLQSSAGGASVDDGLAAPEVFYPSNFIPSHLIPPSDASQTFQGMGASPPPPASLGGLAGSTGAVRPLSAVRDTGHAKSATRAHREKVNEERRVAVVLARERVALLHTAPVLSAPPPPPIAATGAGGENGPNPAGSAAAAPGAQSARQRAAEERRHIKGTHYHTQRFHALMKDTSPERDGHAPPLAVARPASARPASARATSRSARPSSAISRTSSTHSSTAGGAIPSSGIAPSSLEGRNAGSSASRLRSNLVGSRHGLGVRRSLRAQRVLQRSVVHAATAGGFVDINAANATLRAEELHREELGPPPPHHHSHQQQRPSSSGQNHARVSSHPTTATAAATTAAGLVYGLHVRASSLTAPAPWAAEEETSVQASPASSPSAQQRPHQSEQHRRPGSAGYFGRKDAHHVHRQVLAEKRAAAGVRHAEERLLQRQRAADQAFLQAQARVLASAAAAPGAGAAQAGTAATEPTHPTAAASPAGAVASEEKENHTATTAAPRVPAVPLAAPPPTTVMTPFGEALPLPLEGPHSAAFASASASLPAPPLAPPSSSSTPTGVGVRSTRASRLRFLASPRTANLLKLASSSWGAPGSGPGSSSARGQSPRATSAVRLANAPGAHPPRSSFEASQWAAEALGKLHLRTGPQEESVAAAAAKYPAYELHHHHHQQQRPQHPHPPPAQARSAHTVHWLTSASAADGPVATTTATPRSASAATPTAASAATGSSGATAPHALVRHKFFPVRASALSGAPGRGGRVSGGVVGGGPTGGADSGAAAAAVAMEGAEARVAAAAQRPGSAIARGGNRHSYAPASSQPTRPQSALSRSSRSAGAGAASDGASGTVRALKVVSFNDLPSTRRDVLGALHHHPDESRLFANMWTPASIITAPNSSQGHA